MFVGEIPSFFRIFTHTVISENKVEEKEATGKSFKQDNNVAILESCC